MSPMQKSAAVGPDTEGRRDTMSGAARPVACLLMLAQLGAGCAAAAHPAPRASDASAEVQSPLPPPPDSVPLIRTDREEYRLRYVPEDPLLPRQEAVLSVGHTFTNRTADTVYVAECFLELARRTPDGWEEGPAPVCPAIWRMAARVAPGGSFTDTLTLRYHYLSRTRNDFEIDRAAGTYRLVRSIFRQWDRYGGPSDLLPLELRVSNPFRVER